MLVYSPKPALPYTGHTRGNKYAPNPNYFLALTMEEIQRWELTKAEAHPTLFLVGYHSVIPYISNDLTTSHNYYTSDNNLTTPTTKPALPCKPGDSGPQRAGSVGAQKSANRLGPGSSFCSQVVHRRQEARQGGGIMISNVPIYSHN